MRAISALTIIMCAWAGAAAADDGGWDIYGRVSNAVCGTRPVLLQGNHTDLRVNGPCHYVRVAGEHNDIHIDIVAGGTIEITGAHNDVWWHALTPGRQPVLLDHGESNTFHRGE